MQKGFLALHGVLLYKGGECMKIDIIGRNYEVSERLKQITNQKLGKLDKYFDSSDVLVKVCFKKEASALTTEVMLDYTGKFVRATASSNNFYDNLDVVLPKLEGQIRKHRTKFDKHSKNNAFKEDSEFFAERYQVEEKKNVVKNKKFKLESETLNEAIETMELLGHNFYVYKDAKTNEIKILYKRIDGDLGLIEPE